MGVESRKRVEEIFDEKIIIDQTVSVYRKAGVVWWFLNFHREVISRKYEDLFLEVVNNRETGWD